MTDPNPPIWLLVYLVALPWVIILLANLPFLLRDDPEDDLWDDPEDDDPDWEE